MMWIHPGYMPILVRGFGDTGGLWLTVMDGRGNVEIKPGYCRLAPHANKLWLHANGEQIQERVIAWTVGRLPSKPCAPEEIKSEEFGVP